MSDSPSNIYSNSKCITPYQQVILDNAIKLSKSKEGMFPVTKILLHAIEERDKLLEEYYKFFGEGTKEAERIGRVLEIP